MAVMLATGIGLSLVAFLALRHSEREHVRAKFRLAAEERIAAVEETVRFKELLLETLAAYFNASPQVDRWAFAAFVRPLLSRSRGIQALEWIPRVPHAERAAYEAAVRREGFAEFQVTERRAQGQMVRAAVREEYFPVHFVEPYQGNEPALGFDIGSETVRLEALERARDTGQMAATAPIILVQERKQQAGFLLFLPVYRKGAPTDSVDDRRRNLEGFVLGVYRVGDIVHNALHHLRAGDVDLRLVDTTLPSSPGQFLYAYPPRPLDPSPGTEQEGPSFVGGHHSNGVPPARLTHSETFDVAGRRWSVVCTSARGLTANGTWQAWAALGAGLALTSLLVTNLAGMSGRAVRAQQLAERLLEGNRKLESEVQARHEAEQALRAGMEKYRHLFEHLNDAAFLADAETGIVLEANAQAEALLRRPRYEIVGMHQTRLHPPDQAAVYRSKFAAHIESGRILDFRAEVLRSDGTIVPVSISASMLAVGDRRVLLGLFRDIAPWIEAERRVREVHVQTETLLASISSILIGLNQGSRVMRWNAAAERTFGRSAAEAAGKRLEECGLTWDWTRVARGIETCRCTGQIIRLDDIPFVDPAGRSGLLGLTISPMRRADGQPCGCVIVGSDITERRALERQLAQAQKLESIGQLAAGIAHELNTPIQYVADNTRFLQEAFGDLCRCLRACQRLLAAAAAGPVPPDLVGEIKTALEQTDLGYFMEEIPKAIEQSVQGVERVAAIVRAMKDFSHPGTKERVAVDINAAIQSTATVSRNEWKYVADLVTDFDRDLPPVLCFPGDLNQAMLNLIINAAHAIADAVGDRKSGKGTITIRTRRDGDWVEIRTSDTGTGIPEAIRSRIFDPFFTTKDVGKGTGQGLAIAHAVVVERHGGSITFETEMGKGTTFVIRLPIGAVPEEAAETQSVASLRG